MKQDIEELKQKLHLAAMRGKNITVDANMLLEIIEDLEEYQERVDELAVTVNELRLEKLDS